MTIVTSSNELERLLECIHNGRSFVLSGGAGSGKTYTLVEVIQRTLSEFPLANLACVTYTRAGTREIEERTSHDRLLVSTIHQFLWNCIKNFQLEIASCIIEISQNEENRAFRIDGQAISPAYFESNNLSIQYKDYLRIRSGIISHDEILLVANLMFAKHEKLCGIFKDKYPFIFVDEYQDTDDLVIEILLDHLPKSPKPIVIGFFGDSMQAIYERGIGSLNGYLGDGPHQLIEIRKKQNRRNPESVIALANKLRTDGLTQAPSEDLSAPNMDSSGKVKVGVAVFLYSSNEDINAVRKRLGWDFSNSVITKELNLTHNLIAEKAGFQELMKIYDKDQILAYRNRVRDYIKDTLVTTDFSKNTFGEAIAILKQDKSRAELKRVSPTDGQQAFIDAHPELWLRACAEPFGDFLKLYVEKDQLLDDKPGVEGGSRDALIAHLIKLEDNIRFYQAGEIADFIRKTDYRVRVAADKDELSRRINELVAASDKTIGQVIELADSHGICKKDDKLNIFIERSGYIFDRVTRLEYSEFQSLYKYLHGHTPFSTQHRTKGREYENVLVILDNGKWNSYNFENLFLSAGKATILERTQKIFYVCCTRAMQQLAVFYHKPSLEIIEQAKRWFGADCVVDLDSVQVSDGHERTSGRC